MYVMELDDFDKVWKKKRRRLRLEMVLLACVIVFSLVAMLFSFLKK